MAYYAILYAIYHGIPQFWGKPTWSNPISTLAAVVGDEGSETQQSVLPNNDIVDRKGQKRAGFRDTKVWSEKQIPEKWESFAQIL